MKTLPNALAVLLLLALLLIALAFFQQLQSYPRLYGDKMILILPDGFQVEAEIADNASERANGLMFRGSLCEHCGMLFFLPYQAIPSFWMKNMRFPIDIIFLDEGMRAVKVFENVPPCEEEQCEHYSPERQCSFVLELPAFTAKKHNLSEGARIRRE